MSTFKSPFVAASLVMLAPFACNRAPAPSSVEPSEAPAIVYADMMIHGGPIYVGGGGEKTVEAVAIVNGVISATGAWAGVKEAAGPETRIIDLDGAAMYPGFTDAHAHLFGIGMRELTLNLEEIGSVAELKAVVAAETETVAGGDVIFGRGWIETGWPEDRMPSRDDLDAVAPDHPVILLRADGHALVANSAALARAGITDETPDPVGGRIERGSDGRATGLLIDNAMPLVMVLIAAPSEARKREAYETASDVYAAYGWTSLHNMSVDPADIALMEGLADAEALQIRVYNSVDEAGLAALEADGPRQNNDGRIVTRAMKLYVDGALGSRGAALSAPYSDAPDTDGLLLMTAREAADLYDRALAADIQVATHAIGDRGNNLVLDWYHDAFERNNASGDQRRWRIEHAQILHTDDIPRFSELGVIASMQPSHAIGDLFFAPARLGPDRLNGAYAWRSLIDAGAIIAAGSDAPVERGSALIEFYAAVERRGLDGTQTEDWRAQEAVSRAEALKMFTEWPAYTAFQEETLGTIEVGKLADFTVFSKDIMTVPAAEILTAKPVMTIVGGDIVFQAE